MILDDTFNQKRKLNTSSFHQQTLKGWKPIINTNNLYLSFFILGSIFIIAGSVLIYFSYQINELHIDYTNCQNIEGHKCSDILSQLNYTQHFKSCECIINVTIPQTIKNSVFVYYGLSNFYQNHRQYVKSRDDKQLNGLDVKKILSSNCEPYQYKNQTSYVGYAPCGLIANSLFNDTFELKYYHNGSLIAVPWTNKGIAWSSETRVIYGQPNSWDNTVPPPNWPISAQNRDKALFSGDEDLIVWMRSAALPNLRKFYRIVQHEIEPFTSGLPRGSYVLSINYSYPVTSFSGTKKLILSNTNYLGGKNPALGIEYLLVGIIHFSLAIAFVFINQIVSGRRELFDLKR